MQKVTNASCGVIVLSYYYGITTFTIIIYVGHIILCMCLCRIAAPTSVV